jgi:hypothetical protein
MLENISNGAATPARNSSPIFFSQVVQVGKEGMRGVALESLFDEPGKGINNDIEFVIPPGAFELFMLISPNCLNTAQEFPKMYLSKNALRNLPCGS